MSERRKDSDLSAGARSFLDEVRDHDGPTAEDRDRVKRALVATIASGAGLAATSAASTAAASTTAGTAAAGTAAAGTAAAGTMVAATAAGGMTVGVKIALVAFVAAAIGGTALVTIDADPTPEATTGETVSAPLEIEVPRNQREGTPQAEVAAATSESATPEPAEASPNGEADAEEPGAASEPPAVAELSPGRVRQAGRQRGPAPPPEVAPTEAVPAAGSSLTRELVLIRRAQRALQSGDANAALRHLDEHADRFATGVLSEEREAARVVALCEAGRPTQSRALAQRFVRERPSSPHRARVLAACPEQ